MGSEFNNWYEKWTGSKVKCENTDIIGAWQHQQSKIDELQKENAALVHVVKSRDIQLQNEKHEYDELMNKLVDSGMKNAELQKQRDSFIKAYEIEVDKSVDLQKRVDALIQKYKDEDRELKLIDEWEKSQIYGLVASELEQVLKGGRE